MPIKRVQKKIDWTPEDRARHQAIRETYHFDTLSVGILLAPRKHLPAKNQNFGLLP